MGFTRAFRNLQGKFSARIATFNFQPCWAAGTQIANLVAERRGFTATSATAHAQSLGGVAPLLLQLYTVQNVQWNSQRISPSYPVPTSGNSSTCSVYLARVWLRETYQAGVPGDQNTISRPFVGGHVRSRDMGNECKKLSASYMHGYLWYFKYSEINCICWRMLKVTCSM